MYTKALTFHIM